VPGGASYEVRHGFGYTRFRHASHGLEQDTSLFVPPDDPVKVVRLRLANTRRRARRLTLFAYFRLVLGVLPGCPVVTRLDARAGVLLARNPEGEFRHGVTFAAAVAPGGRVRFTRSEEHTSELQSRFDLVCRLLLEKKNLAMALASGAIDIEGSLAAVYSAFRVPWIHRLPLRHQ